MADALEGYNPRQWETYVVSFEDGKDLPMELCKDFVCCPVESVMGQRIAEQDNYDPSRMFFPDFEQLVAGRTPYGTGPLMRLTADYRSHPEGSLAFISYELVESQEHLLFVEKS